MNEWKIVFAKEGYKVLVYKGTFVDVPMLNKGVYGCRTPYKFRHDETMESLIEKVTNGARNSLHGILFYSNDCVRNLKECELIVLDPKYYL